MLLPFQLCDFSTECALGRRQSRFWKGQDHSHASAARHSYSWVWICLGKKEVWESQIPLHLFAHLGKPAFAPTAKTRWHRTEVILQECLWIKCDFNSKQYESKLTMVTMAIIHRTTFQNIFPYIISWLTSTFCSESSIFIGRYRNGYLVLWEYGSVSNPILGNGQCMTSCMSLRLISSSVFLGYKWLSVKPQKGLKQRAWSWRI